MEVFPPKRHDGNPKELIHVVSNLKDLHPDFISVTYGAGGSTQDLTLEIASAIKNNIGILTMAHLTCVGNTPQEILNILDQFKAHNIDHILALRGDPPVGQTSFKPVPGGFSYAGQLMEFIKKERSFFNLGVAAYPEKHPEAINLQQDIENLKKKVDQGADFIITQLFFNNQHFYDFVDKIRKVGIKIPILPGVFLLSNYKQLSRISQLSPVDVPHELSKKLIQYQDDLKASEEIGAEFALKQSQDLIKSKAIQGIHFYIMNKKEMISQIFPSIKALV